MKLNAKMNILRIILIILLLITFRIIFSFSDQDGEKSGSISRKITEFVTENIRSIQKLEKNKKEEILKKIEHIIRKLAHFSIYTFVGILLMSLAETYNLNKKRKVGVSIGVGILYAISDEIHQSFIPDRTPQITDVCIDTLGVAFGILIVIVCIKKYIKCKNHLIF